MQIFNVLVQQGPKEVVFRVDEGLQCPLCLFQVSFGQLVDVLNVIVIFVCDCEVTHLLNLNECISIGFFLHSLEMKVVPRHLKLVKTLSDQDLHL